MATVSQHIGIEEDLVREYDQLAEATGRSRDQLFVEALRLYARTEGRQITEVRRTLTTLEAGTLKTVTGDEVTARFLSAGRITSAALAKAEERYGIPLDVHSTVSRRVASE